MYTYTYIITGIRYRFYCTCNKRYNEYISLILHLL